MGQGRPSRRSGLGARLTLGASVVLALSLGAVTALLTAQFRAALLDDEFAALSTDAARVSSTLGGLLDGVRENVRALSLTPPPGGIARARAAGGVDPLDGSTEELWVQRLRAIFEAFLTATPSYTQARLIGVEDGGRELLRVERARGGEPVRVVPAEELQRKGDRDYVLAALALPAGEVHLSDIEFNVDHGVVDRAHPTVRASTRVDHVDGSPLGVLVINQDMGPAFARVRSQTRRSRDVHVYNALGEELMHATTAREHGLASGAMGALLDAEGQRAVLEGARRSDTRILGRGDDRWVVAVERLALPFAGDRAELRVVVGSSYASLVERVREALADSLLLGAIATGIAVVLLLLFARSVTRPLARIAEVVARFDPADGSADELPVERGDEIGDLARTFRQMTADVSASARALAESERRLSLSVEAGGIGTWLWSPDDDRWEGDARARRLLGVPDTPGMTYSLASFVSHAREDDRASLGHAVRATLDGSGCVLEFGAEEPGGGRRELAVRGECLRDEAGRPTLVVGVLQDVTVLRRGQRLEQHARALEKSNEALRTFAHVASHDLKEPLRSISSYVGLLARRYEGRLDDDADEYIAFVQKGTARMRTLIDELLRYSVLGVEGAPFETFPLRRPLDDAVESLSAALDEAGATLDVDGTFPDVSGDESQLRQLFQNLLSNALKYRADAPPHVTVRARVHEHEVRVDVVDNGIGLDPKHAERIFEVFQRLHGPEDYPGTGMGLALARRIVERHGGDIGVESEPGAGAVFTFTLALDPRGVSAPARTPIA